MKKSMFSTVGVFVTAVMLAVTTVPFVLGLDRLMVEKVKSVVDSLKPVPALLDVVTGQ